MFRRVRRKVETDLGHIFSSPGEASAEVLPVSDSNSDKEPSLASHASCGQDPVVSRARLDALPERDHIAIQGGDTTKEKTSRILRIILAPAVATEFNWFGAKGKKKFVDTNICKLMCTTLTDKQVSTQVAFTIKEIEKSAMSWFRHAAERAAALQKKMEAEKCFEVRTSHCYVCRSRSQLGDCRDPFPYNETTVEGVRGVEASPCASKWCGKLVEGRDDDFDLATERMCLQRPPDDLEERCAETLYQNRRVYMCFCRGDLCNGAHKTATATGAAAIALALAATWAVNCALQL
ncbi:hypothetical protein MTO96_003502 [Rhipicephalus appendiculatus]